MQVQARLRREEQQTVGGTGRSLGFTDCNSYRMMEEEHPEEKHLEKEGGSQEGRRNQPSRRVSEESVWCEPGQQAACGPSRQRLHSENSGTGQRHARPPPSTAHSACSLTPALHAVMCPFSKVSNAETTRCVLHFSRALETQDSSSLVFRFPPVSFQVLN